MAAGTVIAIEYLPYSQHQVLVLRELCHTLLYIYNNADVLLHEIMKITAL
jgi:hypothetical protein